MGRKVFVINSMTHGGSERVLSLLLEALADGGLEVELVCLEADRVQTIPAGVRTTCLSSMNGREAAWVKIVSLPLLAWRLRRYLRGRDVDVVQSHIFRANFVNLLAAMFGAAYRVQLVEVLSVRYFFGRGLSGRLNLALIRWLYNRADLIVFKSEQMRRHLHAYMALRSAETVIPNPYDVARIEAQAREVPVDVELDGAHRRVVTVGRLSDQKNQRMLIGALASLPSDVELWIVGEGEARPALERRSAEAGLGGRVRLLGARSNPFAYVARADVFVLASNQEGFPNVLVEAMLCRTPVISTDCPSGPREILAPETDLDTEAREVETTPCGILTPVGDEAALVSALRAVLDDPLSARRRAEAAYARACAFDVESVAHRYREILCAES